MIPKVFAHGPYIGTTGYANHTREFFRHLSKLIPIKVRNFTIGKNWDWPNPEPHNGEPYINKVDKNLLKKQTLWTGKDTREDFNIYQNYGENFEHNVNLVLMETNHHYFYDRYKGPKIGYNVWETTRQPEGFFKAWNKFDQLWVPTQWQAQMTIKQGADPDKVKVVPEGVDVDTFYPAITLNPKNRLAEYHDNRFKFIHFGRWDYRKSTKEIIETFLKEFKSDEPVDLILSIDNQWGKDLDGYETTEERLKGFGFDDPRLKVIHFPSREDYVKYLQTGHVFLSCARSEGWNLPLIEAMACGTPSIYSNCSGQLEYAQGKGLPVKILGEKPATDNYYSNFGINLEDKFISGNYYEPDFEDLARVMRDAYENYTSHKEKAYKEAKLIHNDFNWDKIAEIGKNTLQEFMDNYKELEDTNTINVSYIDKPKVEILGEVYKEYEIEFINKETSEVIHKHTISNNMWTACSKQYYIPWLIKVNGKIIDEFNLENKRVLISIESKSIGDTIAWVPYVTEFAKKHNCKIILSTFHNDWFQGLETYKDIEFTSPGSSIPCYAVYRIGWFRSENGKWDDFNSYPNYLQSQPLQKTATDILGLEFKELNHGLNFKKGDRPYKQKYVVIGPNATAGCKEWKYEYWVILAKLLTQQGYMVISLTQNEYKMDGVINHYGHPIKDVINYIYHADLFIGLGSGLSWLNWAIGKHTAMINGFAEPGHEFTKKVTRIFKENVCFPCWTNPNFAFDAGDWDWCPIWKGTDKQHICQKSITPQIVMSKIKPLLKK
jgi:autotransporter strand-loop-strand O-heptosyltransferase